MKIPNLIFDILLSGFATVSIAQTDPATADGWEKVRNVKMSGGLRAFWDVNGASLHQVEALKHGFDPVNLLGDFSDYPGKQKRNISTYLQRNGHVATNPWDMPEFFEEILRQNVGLIANKPNVVADETSIFVHDIEFAFEQDIEKAFADPATKKASGATTIEEFQEAFLAK